MTNSLLNIQSKLIAPKGQFNSFGKYAYRSTEDILKAVKPLLEENNATLTLTDEPVLIGDWHYIKATAALKVGEEVKTVSAYARESDSKKGMDTSQITGTASSYARKYALNGLFLIDDTKDADSDAYHQQNNRSAAKKQTAKPKPQMSQQEQTTVQNKGKLFSSFVEQIAVLIGAEASQVKNQLITEAQNKPEYDKANKNEQATILLRLAETMKNEAQKKNEK